MTWWAMFTSSLFLQLKSSLVWTNLTDQKVFHFKKNFSDKISSCEYIWKNIHINYVGVNIDKSIIEEDEEEEVLSFSSVSRFVFIGILDNS